jgi:hypothetical protein
MALTAQHLSIMLLKCYIFYLVSLFLILFTNLRESIGVLSSVYFIYIYIYERITEGTLIKFHDL